MLGALLGTVDANLQTTLDAITAYFTSNIGIVITAVLGVVLLVWFVRMAFHSFGARKPKSVT